MAPSGKRSRGGASAPGRGKASTSGAVRMDSPSNNNSSGSAPGQASGAVRMNSPSNIFSGLAPGQASGAVRMNSPSQISSGPAPGQTSGAVRMDSPSRNLSGSATGLTATPGAVRMNSPSKPSPPRPSTPVNQMNDVDDDIIDFTPPEVHAARYRQEEAKKQQEDLRKASEALGAVVQQGSAQPMESVTMADRSRPVAAAVQAQPVEVFPNAIAGIRAQWERAEGHRLEGQVASQPIETAVARRTVKVSISSVTQGFPAPWQFNERRAAALYPDFIAADINNRYSLHDVYSSDDAYRGMDRPPFKVAAKKNIGGRMSAFIRISGIQNGQEFCQHVGTPTPSTQSKAVVPGRPGTEERAPPPVKVVLRLDTQKPCIVLYFDLPENGGQSSRVRCEIYCSTLRASRHDISLRFYTAPRGEDVPDHPDVRALFEKKHLWLVKFAVAEGRTRPIFSGISEQRLQEFAARWERFEDQDDTSAFLGALSSSTVTNSGFTVATTLTGQATHEYERFGRMFTACAFASAHMGNYWWYRMAAGTATSAPNFPFGLVPIPRWLATEWNIIYDAADRIVNVVATDCAKLVAKAGEMYPDSDTLAFELRLSVARDLSRTTRRLQELTAGNQSVRATFRQVDEGMFVAFITMARSVTNEGVEVHCIPEVDTVATLGVQVNNRDYWLKGSVVHNPTTKDDVQFVLALTTEAASRGLSIADPNKSFAVVVEFPNDVTSSNRMLNAIASIHAGHTRSVGVDMRSVLFSTPVAPDHDTIWLSRWLSEEGRGDKFLGQLNLFQLNQTQFDAVIAFATSKTGLNLLWGPAGTGKTRALCAFISSILTTECLILVTAPQNDVLNQLMESLGSYPLPAGIDNMCLVRFTGALSHTLHRERDRMPGQARRIEAAEQGFSEPLTGSWADAVIEGEEEAVRLAEQVMYEDLMMDALGKSTAGGSTTAFADRKIDWVRSLAAQQQLVPSQEQQRVALYLAILEKIKRLRENGRKVDKELRKEFTEADEYFTREYLAKKVRVVFCTNSTAYHEALENFRPDILLMEEAGLASVPDAIVPMAAHKETIKQVILIGDHLQNSPVVAGNESNEASPKMQQSIFQQLFEDEFERFPRNTLTVQYRMTAQLSAFPRMRIYENRVIDAPNKNAKDDVQRTVDVALEPFRPAWNGRYRIGIDCDQPHGYKEGSTSPHNMLEAVRALEVAVQLVSNGLDPASIVVMSPYRGQVRELKHYFRSQNSSHALKSVRISTTLAMQGSEADVVILSLTANSAGDANRLGFILDQRQLTVELTRAKSCLIVLGNFRGWIRVIKANDPAQRLHHWQARTFKAWLENMFEQKDIISSSDWEVAGRGEVLSGASFYMDPAFRSQRPPPGRQGPSNKRQKTGGRYREEYRG